MGLLGRLLNSSEVKEYLYQGVSVFVPVPTAATWPWCSLSKVCKCPTVNKSMEMEFTCQHLKIILAKFLDQCKDLAKCNE